MTNLLDFISKIADGVIAVDQNQRIVLWNIAAERLLGFKAEEVLGRFCDEVMVGRDASGRSICDKSCSKRVLQVEQELIPTQEIMVRARSGQAIWLSMSTVVVPSPWKDLCVLVHLFRNISHQKEVERSIQQLLITMAKLPSSQATSPALNLPPSPLLLHLTAREREVLRLLASGKSTKVIATKLFISPATMRNHIHNILIKLGVENRLEAATLVLRNGFI